MMRNAISDIDSMQSERDRETRAHSSDLLREKWSGRSFAYDGVEHAVSFNCSFDGAIANRCLEFSALDRVIYNLMNNAGRYTVDRQIGINIFEVESGPSGNVRFVVQNRIAAEQSARILELTGGETNRLLQGGITSGGNGIGLSICTDFVRNAFGLSSADLVIAGGYVGVKIVRDVFVVWFHWPKVDFEPVGSVSPDLAVLES